MSSPVSRIPEFDIWFRCGSNARTEWSLEAYLYVAALTFAGMSAGFGITRFVQATVPLHVRMELIKLGHCLSGIFWLLPFITCNSFTFVGIALNTYLLGSEPYDNVFSPELWRVVRLLRTRGDKMTQYWAYSSLVVHFWFVVGAAVATLGLDAPAWIFFAIPGFQASHFARLFAYEHWDIAASIAEVVGLLTLTGCLIVSCMRDSVFVSVWLAVALTERYSHLPAALRCDARWMRSYELWIEAVATADRIEVENARCVQVPISASSPKLANASSDAPLESMTLSTTAAVTMPP
jgi:hypothetical protein